MIFAKRTSGGAFHVKLQALVERLDDEHTKALEECDRLRAELKRSRADAERAWKLAVASDDEVDSLRTDLAELSTELAELNESYAKVLEECGRLRAELERMKSDIGPWCNEAMLQQARLRALLIERDRRCSILNQKNVWLVALLEAAEGRDR